MNWTCPNIELHLSEYVDGALHPNDRRDFDAHVNSCPHCTALVSSVSRLVTRLHTMEELDPPQRLVSAILDQTIGPREVPKGWHLALHWMRGLASPRLAYGALSVGITIMVLLSASGFSLRKPKLADLSPASVYRNVDRQSHLIYARGTKFVSDLRVVYEIQSRLRQENEIPPGQEAAPPQTSPQKAPGRTDQSEPSSPKQQNRANDLVERFRSLSARVLSPSPRDFSALIGPLGLPFAGRRSR